MQWPQYRRAMPCFFSIRREYPAFPLRRRFRSRSSASCFSVTTPFPVKELCWLGEDRLAVVLEQNGTLWISLIDTAMRTATVPIELPPGSHDFCRGEAGNSVCFLRNTEVFSLNPENGDIRKLTSLLSIGVNPSEVALLFLPVETAACIFCSTFGSLTRRRQSVIPSLLPCCPLQRKTPPKRLGRSLPQRRKGEKSRSAFCGFLTE